MSEERDADSLEAILRDFLRHHKYLHEFRLQKLVYILDLVTSLKEDGKRATDADFKPYMYGSYSDSLRDTLNGLEGELPTEQDWLYGKVVTKYLGADHPRVNDGNPDGYSQYEDLIEKIREATAGISNDDLENWSKESWLYENTDYDSEMNFEEVEKHEEEIREDLLDMFPELKDEFEDERNSGN